MALGLLSIDAWPGPLAGLLRPIYTTTLDSTFNNPARRCREASGPDPSDVDPLHPGTFARNSSEDRLRVRLRAIAPRRRADLRGDPAEPGSKKTRLLRVGAHRSARQCPD